MVGWWDLWLSVGWYNIVFVGWADLLGFRLCLIWSVCGVCRLVVGLVVGVGWVAGDFPGF